MRGTCSRRAMFSSWPPRLCGGRGPYHGEPRRTSSSHVCRSVLVHQSKDLHITNMNFSQEKSRWDLVCFNNGIFPLNSIMNRSYLVVLPNECVVKDNDGN